MKQPDYPAGLPFNFAGLDEEYCNLESSRVAILPVPYDFSTSYQGGTRLGPQAILAASRNMEVWDDELGPTYRAGIATLPELEPTAEGPGAQVKRVEQAFDYMYDIGKLPVMLGGEHSITAGAVRAAAKRYGKLSVLQIDAHADMRDEYLETPDSHACVMRRIREICPAASVGIRSLSEEEAAFLRETPAPIWSTRQFRALKGDFQPILDALTEEVFITFDLDGLDPAYLPGTGTPEPGGLDWFEVSDLIGAVADSRRIVGFDVVELAPLAGNVASDFLAARVTYRMIGHMLRSQGWKAPR